MNKDRTHHPKQGICNQGHALMRFSFALSEPFKTPNAWIIPKNSGLPIKNKYDPGIEIQPNPTPQWRYPFIVVYKRIAYLAAMIHAYSLGFNKIE